MEYIISTDNMTSYMPHNRKCMLLHPFVIHKFDSSYFHLLSMSIHHHHQHQESLTTVKKKSRNRQKEIFYFDYYFTYTYGLFKPFSLLLLLLLSHTLIKHLLPSMKILCTIFYSTFMTLNVWESMHELNVVYAAVACPIHILSLLFLCVLLLLPPFFNLVPNFFPFAAAPLLSFLSFFYISRLPQKNTSHHIA